MNKYLALSLVATGSVFAVAAPASALPGLSAVDTATLSHVQSVRSDCSWINGGWFYRNGVRFVTCRPDRPGREYSWHREGNHFGWYHSGRKEWHNKNW